MTSSHQRLARQCEAALEEFIDPNAAAASPAALLDLLLAAGRRGTGPEATRAALLACWQQLTCSTVSHRAAVCDQLRVAISTGVTTARAWLPIALGETEPLLIGLAVRGYLGVTPCGIEQREQALVDALEWFRRDLALDRVAVFAGLLALGDVRINERLVSLRGRLTDGERERVQQQFAAATDAPTREFFAAWQTDLPEHAAVSMTAW